MCLHYFISPDHFLSKFSLTDSFLPFRRLGRQTRETQESDSVSSFEAREKENANVYVQRQNQGTFSRAYEYCASYGSNGQAQRMPFVTIRFGRNARSRTGSSEVCGKSSCFVRPYYAVAVAVERSFLCGTSVSSCEKAILYSSDGSSWEGERKAGGNVLPANFLCAFEWFFACSRYFWTGSGSVQRVLRKLVKISGS